MAAPVTVSKATMRSASGTFTNNFLPDGANWKPSGCAGSDRREMTERWIGSKRAMLPLPYSTTKLPLAPYAAVDAKLARVKETRIRHRETKLSFSKRGWRGLNGPMLNLDRNMREGHELRQPSAVEVGFACVCREDGHDGAEMPGTKPPYVKVLQAVATIL